MRQEEYIKIIVYNNQLVVLGDCDVGQCYIIEYLKDGKRVIESCGTYNNDYKSYIKSRLSTPNCNDSFLEYGDEFEDQEEN